MKTTLPILLLICSCGSEKVQEPQTTRCASWEYKVQYAQPNPKVERKGDSAGVATSVTPNQQELNALGAEGWELASSYLETETAYPILDRSSVPNVRPQRLVLLFKKPACK